MRLVDDQNERQAALDEINRNDLVDFDNENNDSPCPIFAHFITCVEVKVLCLCNFSPAEFHGQ
jgi:hypothetical protein